MSAPMNSLSLQLFAVVAPLIARCQDDTNSPTAEPESPVERDLFLILGIILSMIVVFTCCFLAYRRSQREVISVDELERMSLHSVVKRHGRASTHDRFLSETDVNDPRIRYQNF